MKAMRRSSPRGFTLVELLVVITIIGILAGTLLPSMPKVLERGRRVACASNLRQISAALMTYAHDNEGRLPFTGVTSDSANRHLGLLFPRWAANEGIFVCRSAATRGYRADNKIDRHTEGAARVESLKPGENCYAYAFGLGGPETEDLPLACDQLAVATISGQQWAKRSLGSNHGDEGGNVLHMDGHVDFLRAAAQGYWPANQPKLRAWDRGQWRDPANADRSPDD